MHKIETPTIEFGELEPLDADIIKAVARKGEQIERALQIFCDDDFGPEESPSERIIHSIADRCMPNGCPPRIYEMKKAK